MTRTPLRRPAAAATGLAAALVLTLVPSAQAPASAAPEASVAPVAVAAAPVTRTSVIGTSVEGRPITAIHRYWPGVANRKTVVVIGTVHGDEPAGTRVTTRLTTAKLPRNVNLWIIPTGNPDGLAAGRRTNAHKVDLNRNFPYRWKRINVGKSTYSGPSKASEPETKALIRFFKKVKPRQTVVFHQPLYGVGTSVKRMDVVKAYSRETGLPVKSFACTGVCYGSFGSWHNRAMSGVSVTVEFGAGRPSVSRIKKATAAVLKIGSRY
jgi:protein MpaA